MEQGQETSTRNAASYPWFSRVFFFLYSLSVPRSPLKKSPVFTGNINGPSWRVKDARLLLLSHCEVILFLPMTILADSTIFRYSSVWG